MKLRNIDRAAIIKSIIISVMLTAFIVIAATGSRGFHDNETRLFFYILIGVMLLESVLTFYMIWSNKRFLRFPKSLIALAVSVTVGWITAISVSMLNKGESWVPAEYVFGSIYAMYTVTVITIWLYSAASVYIKARPLEPPETTLLEDSVLPESAQERIDIQASELTEASDMYYDSAAAEVMPYCERGVVSEPKTIINAEKIIPADIPIVNNDFVPTGKFTNYVIKDETRGKYEEVERENERKVALMTDLTHVIITSNINAMIVPLETRILERTFENKMRFVEDETKEWYSNIKNLLLSYTGMKSRISKLADTFKYNGEVFVKLMVSGKTLLVNLDLDADKYDNKYYKYTYVGDMSRFQETPYQIRLKNRLSYKRCVELLDLLLVELNAPKDFLAVHINYADDFIREENTAIYSNSIAHLIRRGAKPEEQETREEEE